MKVDQLVSTRQLYEMMQLPFHNLLYRHASLHPYVRIAWHNITRIFPKFQQKSWLSTGVFGHGEASALCSKPFY